MIRVICFLFVLFIIPQSDLAAQDELAIGDWRSFLPHTKGFYVTESEDRVFFVADQTLTRFNKSDLEQQFISTIEGLSGVGVEWASYNSEVGALVVIYKDSNIDIIYEDDIININDIPRNTQLSGDRSVRDLFQWEQSIILATGFGLVVLDLEDAVIREVVQSPSPIEDVSIWNNQFLALMNGEVYSLAVSQIFNFEFWSLWENQTTPWSLESGLSALETFDDKLFFSQRFPTLCSKY